MEGYLSVIPVKICEYVFTEVPLSLKRIVYQTYIIKNILKPFYPIILKIRSIFQANIIQRKSCLFNK